MLLWMISVCFNALGTESFRHLQKHDNKVFELLLTIKVTPSKENLTYLKWLSLFLHKLVWFKLKTQ